MDTLAPLVLLTPLAGFLVNALLGRLLPRRIVGWIGAGSIGLAFVFALVALSQVLGGQRLDQTYFTWWQSADFNVPFNLYLDQLSTLMILVITGVGFLIHVYSIGYMREDPGYSRFFAYMNLFVFAMLLLVLSGNLLWLIIGWAGVGLSSYLLIGFWFERTSAVLAARKAFVMNTIGDVGMVFAAFLIFLNLRVLDFQGLFSRVHQLPKGGGVITAICLLLLVGAVAKSAQLPLHTWLPDAMEGPTPVSALIHAATMVTAGVYLVARMHLLYDWAPAAAATVAVIGGVTALFAATIGTSQVDIKRILAYSTMSQIGYMFLAVGIGAYAAGMFHFMTHAFFKALLFMAAGNVIHAFHDDQDIRHMGNLRAGLPITFWTFLIGTLSISGFPLLAGFFSKDEIIRAALSAPGSEFWLGVIALITAGLTAYYMFRLFFIAFGWEWLSHDDRHLHEALPVQTVPIIILAVGAVVGGYVPVASFLSPVFGHGVEVGTGAFIGLAALSVLAALIGFLTAYLLHARRPDLAVVWRTRLGPIHTLVEHKYYLDELYDRVFVRPGLALARFLNDIVEPRVIDGAVNGVADFFLLEAREFRLIQTGRVGTYALWTLGGAIGVVLVVAAFLGYLPVRLGG
ncbi:MAG: NADH-quinone oxidoreductase subunit [Chloroflexota bacterium]|jgi:NADH-quinone oxidoreductase subunit L|nr:NADH-quinone oxidoreductase subunit [Chloroflexota bacterium]